MHALAGAKPVPAERLVMVQSTGRCGSTLVSHAFASADNVMSFAEPDVYYQLHQLRDHDDAESAVAGDMHHAALCPEAGRHVGDQFRNLHIELAGPLLRLPGAMTVFLYREQRAGLAHLRGPPVALEGLLDHLVRGLAHGGHMLLGDVVHRAAIERDQVPSHLVTPLSRRPAPAAIQPIYERLAPDPTLCQKNFMGLRRSAPAASPRGPVRGQIIAAATGYELVQWHSPSAMTLVCQSAQNRRNLHLVGHAGQCRAWAHELDVRRLRRCGADGIPRHPRPVRVGALRDGQACGRKKGGRRSESGPV